MKTITIQIGNSDDKLTQVEWAKFVAHVDGIIDKYDHEIHFFGGSLAFAYWQNAAWVLECQEEFIPALKRDLSEVREQYRQDSIAYLEGETQFI